MDANTSNFTLTHTDNGDGNDSSSSSISCDGLITKQSMLNQLFGNTSGIKTKML